MSASGPVPEARGEKARDFLGFPFPGRAVADQATVTGCLPGRSGTSEAGTGETMTGVSSSS